MKIGMILDGSFPPDPRVENEALTLIAEGHQVFLWCIDYSKKQKRKEIYKGINITRHYTPKIIRSISALAYSLPLYHAFFKRPISKFIQNHEIESIHIHDIQIARTVFWINKNLKLKTVLDLHENRPEIMKYYAHVNSFLGKILISPSIWKRYESLYITKATAVIVVTAAAKKYYIDNLKLLADTIHIVPNAIRKEFYTDFILKPNIIQKYDKTWLMLYIGDTGLRRGLLTVLKSLHKLAQKIPNIKLVVVGKSKEDQVLKKYVIENNLMEYVDFEGWKDPSHFQSYISVSKIGLSPLHRNIHHDTTYANKLFQYMSFGKPVIVSDCIAQEKLIKKYKCGQTFTAQDENEFAKSVLMLFNNKKLYQEMSLNAKRAIESDLNWSEFSKELINIY